jgi:mannose-1-phosphate guanylyltransferase/phosphomannomutase
MKAIVLCAGYGTRLGDLTREIPKPLLDLNGRPLLHYILSNLAKHGFRDLAINLHFKPEMIRDYVGDGSAWGVRVTYSHEPALLGTAGAVKNLSSFFQNSSEFLVHYGDILTDQDLSSLAQFHQAKQAFATLLLHKRNKSNSRVEMDSSNRITHFLERPANNPPDTSNISWVNSGIYMCSSDILDLIPSGQPVDFPRDIFSQVTNHKALYGLPLSGYRCAIDSPARYQEACNSLAEGRIKIN